MENEKSFKIILKTLVVAVCSTVVVCTMAACGSSSSQDTMEYAADGLSGYSKAASYGDYDNGTGISYDYAEVTEAYDSDSVAASGTSEQTNAKIIYTASIRMESKDFDTALSDIESLANECDAYFESKNVESYSGNYRIAYMTVRVPVENYDKFIEESRGVAAVTSISENAEDVSESYYDLESRLETAKTKLKRLQELLAKADDMTDIITIESSISDTEYEIDSIQGQLNRYDSRIEYSTVTITLEEVYEITDTEKAETFGEKMAKAFSEGMEIFGEFLEGVAIFFASAWLWLVIFIIAPLIVLLLVLKSVKKKRIKEKEQK